MKKNVYVNFVVQCLLLVILIASASFKDVPNPILGIWVSEDNPNYKIEFTLDGKLNHYRDGILKSTDLYSISYSCKENSDLRASFLKLTFNDGGEYCFEINGINESGSGILSLTSMENGKIYIYHRP